LALKNGDVFAGFLKKSYLCRTKKTSIMDTFFQSHRKGITLASNLIFWIVTCLLFVRYSMLRPGCFIHYYKEFVCCGLIAAVVLATRWLTIPKLFSNGKYGLFWLVSVIMLFTATSIEVLLVMPDIQDKIYIARNLIFYLPYLFLMVLFRDSCFFAWFLVFRLYTLQKDTFRAKQRASVMEHQSVQFSTPDQKEISIPIDIMVYIQEVDHTTQVHCTQDKIVTVTEPLSRSKELIPATLWTSDGFHKMVFHQHLSEFFQAYNKPETQVIKTVTLLKNRQLQIFEIIRKHPGCNATFIQDNLNEKVTLRTIERDLASLRDKGVIMHTGSNKGARYEVCTHNVVSVD
jgi:hypothetical protein